MKKSINDYLSREPHQFKEDEDVWYYHESKGISIIIAEDGRAGTRQVVITWQRVVAALRDYETAKKKTNQ